MARLLRTADSLAAARLTSADFNGPIRDGAAFQLRGSYRTLYDGDMVLFRGPEGARDGINVDADENGLFASVQFSPWASLRIGLEAVGEGIYVFRPAPHHMEIFPELRAAGASPSTS